MLACACAAMLALALGLAHAGPARAWAYYDEDGVDAGSTIMTIQMLTHTVTFDSNGGSGISYLYTARDGESLTAPDPAGWVKNGKALTGWNTAADDSGTTIAIGDTLQIYSDVTLYAQYSSDIAMPVSGLDDGALPPWTLLACAGAIAAIGLRREGIERGGE